MNYSGIIPEDTANGLGCRVSIFISGCDNKCPGCFNSELWDYNYGKKFSNFTFNDIVKYIRNPLIKGITILGGDPLSLKNVPDVLKFILRYKKYVEKHKDDGCFGKDNIWIYSGYTYEELINRHDDETNQILENCDVLVDGRFEEKNKHLSLKFRGSINQRIIDLKNTIKNNKIVLLDLEEDLEPIKKSLEERFSKKVKVNEEPLSRTKKKKDIKTILSLVKNLLAKVKELFIRKKEEKVF